MGRETEPWEAEGDGAGHPLDAGRAALAKAG